MTVAGSYEIGIKGFRMLTFRITLYFCLLTSVVGCTNSAGQIERGLRNGSAFNIQVDYDDPGHLVYGKLILDSQKQLIEEYQNGVKISFGKVGSSVVSNLREDLLTETFLSMPEAPLERFRKEC